MLLFIKQFHFHLSKPNSKQEGLCDDFPVTFGYLLKLLIVVFSLKLPFWDLGIFFPQCKTTTNHLYTGKQTKQKQKNPKPKAYYFKNP